MKPAPQLRIQSQLALTPQLQQAIRLLQLSSMELELELNMALESNPLLDIEEEDPAEAEDEEFAPPELGIYAVLPSNRYLPQGVRVLIDFLSEKLGPAAAAT